VRRRGSRRYVVRRRVSRTGVGSATALSRGYRGARCIRLAGRRLGTQASEDSDHDKVGAYIERGAARVEGMLGERKMRKQQANEDGGRSMHIRG
jgi:glutamate synthase domain-containing protein 2